MKSVVYINISVLVVSPSEEEGVTFLHFALSLRTKMNKNECKNARGRIVVPPGTC